MARVCTDSVVTPGVGIRPLEHLDNTLNKLLKIHLREERVSWLFSETLPLTSSGKIKKTPASQLTEYMTGDGKKTPGESDP